MKKLVSMFHSLLIGPVTNGTAAVFLICICAMLPV